MENLEERTLINELSQGKELAMELMSQLQQPSSTEKRDFLVGQILSSYEKALAMINHADIDHNKEPKTTTSLDSPRSVIFYPETSVAYKKRKTMPRWSKQVKVCLGTGIEGPIEDGYSWRKYGQKDILGSSHPRGYYRCTHRHTQSCLATKQVQRSDRDSSILEVTYRGRHTCNIQSSQPPIAIQEAEPLHFTQLEQKDQNPTHPTLLNLKSGLAVKTEEFESMESHIFAPFSFPSTPIEHDYDTVGEPFFSVSNSPWQVGTFGQGNNCYVQTSESDLSDILSAPTSVTNSPMGDYLDIPFDKDFGLNFSFDSSEFLS